MSHTEACRERLLNELMSTPEGRARLEMYDERVGKALEDRDNLPKSQEPLAKLPSHVQRLEGRPKKIRAQEELLLTAAHLQNKDHATTPGQHWPAGGKVSLHVTPTLGQDCLAATKLRRQDQVTDR